MVEKIKANEIKFVKLGEKHDLSKFRSYEPELVDFLLEDALNNQKQKWLKKGQRLQTREKSIKSLA